MARLVQTEPVLMDTRQQVAAVRKDWPERSFQLTVYMGSANPKSIEALRWAAMEEDKITFSAVAKHEFRGAQSSAASCRGTAVQGKCPSDSEEH